MNLLRRFPFLCFLLVLLAVAAFCLVQRSVELLVVAGLLAGLSWYVTEGPRGRTLPRWTSNVLVLAAAGNVLLDVGRNPDDLPGVLGRFTVWLLLIKLYERRTARDHGQLMSLSLLLVLIACAQQPPPLLLGLVVLGYAVLGVYCLLLYQLYASHDRHQRARRDGARAAGETEGSRVPPARPRTGRRTALHLRTLATGVGAAGLALSVLVFVLFPRDVGRGAFRAGTSSTREALVTGFTEQIDLLTGTRITESPRLLATVQVLDAAGTPVRLEETLYLRGSVLEAYRSEGWRPALRSGRSVEAPPGEMVELARASIVERLGPPPRGLRQVVRFPRGTDVLFGVASPVRVAIEGSTPRTVQYTPTTQVLRLPRGEERPTPVRAYEIESIPDAPDEVMARLTDGRRPRSFITGVFGERDHPLRRRVASLADRLLDEARLPRRAASWSWREAAAETFAAHLRSPAFSYTLDLSDVTRDGDPVEQFLFRTRRGHCEYFASALVALCQSVGVEARVIAGFAVREFEPERATYLVRASHAHAWVEVRTGRRTWKTLDPTPPSLTAPTLADDPGLAGRLGRFYQQLEETWADRFVGFDEAAQSELLQGLDQGRSRTLSRWWDDLEAWAAGVNRAFYFGSAGYLWLGLVAFAVAIALVAVIRWLLRRLRVRRLLGSEGLDRGEQRRLLRQLGFYVEMLDVLARAGRPKPDWQPPLAYAGAVGEARPDLGGTVHELAELYYAGRFGGRSLDAEEMARAQRLLAELRSTAGERRRRAGRDGA